MPLIAPVIKQKAKTAALNILKSKNAANGKDNPQADKTHEAVAEAISAVVAPACAAGLPAVVTGMPGAI